MNILLKSIRHFNVIMKHKYYVAQECFKNKLYLQGITHDLSKFSPSEFLPSAKYFQGNRSPVEAEAEDIGYSYAWRHHKGHNKHHWQYWVDWADDKSNNPAPIPTKYLIEMACDLIGAGKAYKGTSNAWTYYSLNKHKWIMHPDSQKEFEIILKGMVFPV